jgi:cbb3-type cytochrome oxidase maturation protein
VSIILVLIPFSVFIAVSFLTAFIWAVRSGQFEDTCTPSMRLILDDAKNKPAEPEDLSTKKETEQP